jgi:DNA gyrase subunit A
VFKSRSSEGVNGMDLAEGEEVISMSVVDHVDLAIEERDEYLRVSGARRRRQAGENGDDDSALELRVLTPERYAELARHEQLLLTVTANGFGKRTSAYEYRVTGRGGKGVELMSLARGGEVVAAFPVLGNDQIMLVTDGGTLIRCPVDGIRIAGRATRGVRIVNVSEGERVVSAVRIGEDDANAENGNGNGDSHAETTVDKD